jgi:hypothetical protein
MKYGDILVDEVDGETIMLIGPQLLFSDTTFLALVLVPMPIPAAEDAEGKIVERDTRDVEWRLDV